MSGNDSSTAKLHANLLSLAEIGEPVAYDSDEFIYRQADPADGLHFLQSGVVKLDVVSRHGRHAIIAILRPGNFFGEASLGGQITRNASAVAMVDSRAYRISRSTMLRLMEADPGLAHQFLMHSVQRSARAEEDFIDRAFNSTEKRLARALLLLADLGGGQEPHPLLESITQQTLAEIVGTTRPRISQFMVKFRRLGFVTSSNPLRVHSSLLEVMLSD